MFIRRKVGPKGQVVIPKMIREYLGIEPGDEVLMEVEEKRLVIKKTLKPERFIEEFCSTSAKKLADKINLEKILEEEVGERLGLR